MIAYGAGEEDEGCAASTMEDGADDCVVDPGRLSELRARVRAQLRHVRDREVLQWARTQRSSLRDLAQTDPLTGVGNRRAFTTALDRAVDDGEPVTLALIDLDHFKHINDTHGHAIGDVVLRCVARALVHAIPQGAVVARWGGEEFAVVVRGELPETPEELGERLRRAVRTIVVPEVDGGLVVTTSVGVAYDGAHRACWSSAEFIQVADRALYESKHGGRDRVTVARTRGS
jgi:diguanylate cyclase (GGDEF)-like protein